jgi:hypothetical protein
MQFLVLQRRADVVVFVGDFGEEDVELVKKVSYFPLRVNFCNAFAIVSSSQLSYQRPFPCFCERSLRSDVHTGNQPELPTLLLCTVTSFLASSQHFRSRLPEFSHSSTVGQSVPLSNPGDAWES